MLKIVSLLSWNMQIADSIHSLTLKNWFWFITYLSFIHSVTELRCLVYLYICLLATNYYFKNQSYKMSSPTEESVRRNSESESGEAETPEHDPHYEPIVTLPLVDLQTNEEEEEELVKIRARLYRYDTADHEWKERGTGDIKLLRHKLNNTVRVVMRRDKTLKVCANHFITPDIRMNVHCGSDKAFNWSVFADYADETCKQELLAIKFGNPQNAELWKSKFAEAQEIVRTKCSLYTQDLSSDDESSITRSEDTDTPEPKFSEKSPDTQKSEEADDGVVLKLKELKVESVKSE